MTSIRRPNVIFVFPDQMRAQATGYAGDPNAVTPHLDRLAAESVRFAHAVSGCPICSPARASLITGQYPHTHGVFVNDVCLRDSGPSFAGAFVDRFGQRPALLISNIGTLVNLVALVIVMSTTSGTGTAWYSVCAVGTSTILRSLQLCAIESVVPLLVPKRHYGRANGPRMLLTGTFVLAGPLLAYVLLMFFAERTVIIAECVLVVIAICVVFAIRLPEVPKPEGADADQPLGQSVAEAYRTLRRRTGIPTMVGYLALVSGVLGALEVAASGTLLGFAPTGYGAIIVSTSCWLGMVVASIAMVVWGIPRRIVSRGLLTAGFIFAAALLAAGFRPNVVLMAVSGFVAMATLAVIIASFSTVMHLKVEPHLLGRMVGLKNTAVTLSHIVGDAGSLWVGMSVFAVAGSNSGDGVWGYRQGLGWEEVSSPVLAAFIGNGPGRGWALFMMLIGLLVGGSVAYLRFRDRSMRTMEQDLPDVTPEDRTDRSTADAGPVQSPVTTSRGSAPAAQAST